MNPRNNSTVLICSAARFRADGEIWNVGDEALTQALATGIRRHTPALHVRATASALGGLIPDTGLERVELRPMSGLFRAIRSADVIVVGGGTLFHDNLPLLRYLAFVAVCARVSRRPLHVVAVGVEDLPRPSAARSISRFVLRSATTVSARDRDSRRLAELVSERSVATVADTVFLLEELPAPPGTDSSDSGDPFICVNLRNDAPPSLVRHTAGLIDEYGAAGVRSKLVPMNLREGGDTTVLDDLRSRALRPSYVEMIAPDGDWRRVLEEIKGAQLCVGMRLHFAIFSSVVGAPTVVVDTLPKTRSFAESMAFTTIPADCSLAQFKAAVSSARPANPEKLAEQRLRAKQALTPIAGSLP